MITCLHGHLSRIACDKRLGKIEIFLKNVRKMGQKCGFEINKPKTDVLDFIVFLFQIITVKDSQNHEILGLLAPLVGGKCQSGHLCFVGPICEYILAFG